MTMVFLMMLWAILGFIIVLYILDARYNWPYEPHYLNYKQYIFLYIIGGPLVWFVGALLSIILPLWFLLKQLFDMILDILE